MKAEFAMTRNIVCINSEDSVGDALELMSEWSIRHLPVVDNEQLVGILSDRDLIGSPTDSNIADVMTKSPITCRTTTTLAEVAETMLDEKIDCIPVMDANGDLVGLITASDFIQLALDRERLAMTHPVPFRFHIYHSVKPGMMSSLLARSPIS